MTLHFSQSPGRQERHLRRKFQNPLFPQHQRQPSGSALTEAQRLDHEELVEFIGSFRELVQRAAALKPNEDSEVILELKERLDKAYEQCAGLADDQQETKRAIVKLVEIIMQAVRAGAGTDQTALLELQQEQQARSAHYQLLEYPLVADLLYPDSPIAADELIATLLSSNGEELDAALVLLDAEQLALLCQEGSALLARTADAPANAAQRLQQLQQALAVTAEGSGS